MGRHLVLTNSKITSLFRQHAWQTSHGISTTLGQYVGRWWCRFANAPKISGALPQIWSAKKRQILDNFFPRLSHSTSHMFGTKRCISKQKCYLWIYNVSPKSLGYLLTYRDLWPRNGWDTFRHCDPPFGRHYVATIKVATCLACSESHSVSSDHIALGMSLLCGRAVKRKWTVQIPAGYMRRPPYTGVSKLSQQLGLQYQKPD